MAKAEKFNVTFKDVFVDPKMEKYKKFLSEYLDCLSEKELEDRWAKNMLGAIIKQVTLEAKDTERIDDLMKNVSLEEMYVDVLLGEKLSDKVMLRADAKSIDLLSRIDNIMMKGKGKLAGWEEKFIFGDTGEDLKKQVLARKWLSEKQLYQLKRIEGILGL